MQSNLKKQTQPKIINYTKVKAEKLKLRIIGEVDLSDIICLVCNDVLKDTVTSCK